jgi:hypothetical protein
VVGLIGVEVLEVGKRVWVRQDKKRIDRLIRTTVSLWPLAPAIDQVRNVLNARAGLVAGEGDVCLLRAARCWQWARVVRRVC